jgi:hypothetical protein
MSDAIFLLFERAFSFVSLGKFFFSNQGREKKKK